MFLNQDLGRTAMDTSTVGLDTSLAEEGTAPISRLAASATTVLMEPMRTIMVGPRCITQSFQ